MKIKLAILDSDQSYLNKIVNVFTTRFSDKIEVYSFTNREVALSTLENTKIDILVADYAFDIDVSKLPKRCGFAYFVESADVETVNDQRAIAKYQKVDLIYRQILDIYSDIAGSLSGAKAGDDSTRLVAFESVGGGCGGSTMAAAYALHLASQGKRALYLNLEKFGSSDSFFSAEGQFDMSDIIYALKSKKANLALKLESCVKQDERGVFFYSRSKIALHMFELSTDEILQLITELKYTGSYDVIVLDLDFSIAGDDLKILRQMNSIVWVGDGYEISNSKLVRAYEALSTIEQNADYPLTDRLLLVYNKFSNKVCKTVEGIEIKNIGGCPRFEHATTEMILEQLAPKEMFDKI